MRRKYLIIISNNIILKINKTIITLTILYLIINTNSLNAFFFLELNGNNKNILTFIITYKMVR